MKILFLTVVALVVPLFFLLIFVLGTYNRLAALRNRCHVNPAGPDQSGAAERQRQAVKQYNEARQNFPASLIAWLFGFGPEQLVSRDAPAPAPSRTSRG